MSNWLSARVGAKRGWGAEHDLDPYSCDEAKIASRLLSEDKLPSVAAILDDSLNSLSFAESYAVFDVFFRYLMSKKKEKEMISLFNGIRQLGGGSDFAQRSRGVFEAQFGKASKTDKSFRRFVEKLSFSWDQTFRSLEAAGDEWVQIAYPKTNAIAWRTEVPRSSRYKITGKLTVLSRKGRQMNLLLDRRKTGQLRGFISLAFSVGNGVTLFEYLPDGAGWKNLAYAKLADLKLDEALEFEVSVRDEELKVKIGGKVVIEETFDGRKLSGAWGLGTQAATAGIWEIEKAPGLK